MTVEEALSATQVKNENTQSLEAASSGAATATSEQSYDKRLDILENMLEKLTTRMVDASRRPSASSVTCDNCGKRGHNRERCFKLKKCYSCGQVGHISKLCKKEKGESDQGQIRYHQTIQTI